MNLLEKLSKKWENFKISKEENKKYRVSNLVIVRAYKDGAEKDEEGNLVLDSFGNLTVNYSTIQKAKPVVLDKPVIAVDAWHGDFYSLENGKMICTIERAVDSLYRWVAYDIEPVANYMFVLNSLGYDRGSKINRTQINKLLAEIELFSLDAMSYAEAHLYK